jgi:hypothetical protein
VVAKRQQARQAADLPRLPPALRSRSPSPEGQQAQICRF